MQNLFSWVSLCSSKHLTISNHYLKVAICTLIAWVIYMGNTFSRASSEHTVLPWSRKGPRGLFFFFGIRLFVSGWVKSQKFHVPHRGKSQWL